LTKIEHFSKVSLPDKENGQIAPGFGSAKGVVQMLSFYFSLFLPEYFATAGQDFLHLRWQNIVFPRKFFNYSVQPDYIFDNEHTLTHFMKETTKSAHPLFLMTFLESNIGRICVSRQETSKGKRGFARRPTPPGGRSGVRDLRSEIERRILNRKGAKGAKKEFIGG